MNRSSTGDLLYVANEGSVGRKYGADVAILTYPQGKQVTTIRHLVPWGICSDKSGNVWVSAQGGTMFEFAHGGKKPIAELQAPSDLPLDCSVDPTTGNLAVILYQAGIVIWPNASGNPTGYPIGATALAYDDKGNLFADGSVSSTLYELPKGASDFISITVNKPGKLSGGVEWDGQYLAVSANDPSAPKGMRNFIYRISVSGSAGTVVQTVYPTRLSSRAWFWVQGSTLIGTVNGTGGSRIGLWHYPKGGQQFEKLSTFYAPRGITVSVAPH
jgi:hypothetical protein